MELRQVEKSHFKAESGQVRIFTQRNFPEVSQSHKQDVHILILHGLGEYHHRHQEIVRYLKSSKLSFHFYWMDLRGHGLSGGTRGHIESFDLFAQDACQWIYNLKKDFIKDGPCFLLGHSMGGVVALDCLQLGFEGAIFSSPALRPFWPFPDWMMGRLHTLSFLLGKLQLSDAVDPDFLSHDPEKVKDYQNDPLILKSISLNLGLELYRKSKKARTESDKIPCPSLFLSGGDDRVVDPKVISLFAKSASKSTHHNYPGLYHELFNELEREKVFKDVLNWLESLL